MDLSVAIAIWVKNSLFALCLINKLKVKRGPEFSLVSIALLGLFTKLT